MNPWTIVAVVASFGKAYATYQAGLAQKAYYDSQADVAKLKYKSKEVEAKEDGVKVLKETNKYLSELIAKGGSSGFMPMEGSMEVAQIVSLRSGSTDFSVTQINQELAQNLGLIEFSNLKAAGKAAKQAGIMGAIFGLGTDIGTIGQAGGFSKKPSTTDVDITSTEGSS
jgi:hypothetical protein|tara:strand:- start:1843 stop:2349 length:507 start_codon:yes stop_codon:yes gene_type:complete